MLSIYISFNPHSNPTRKVLLVLNYSWAQRTWDTKLGSHSKQVLSLDLKLERRNFKELPTSHP